MTVSTNSYVVLNPNDRFLCYYILDPHRRGQCDHVARWAYFVTFRIVGRDYESAVTSTAFCGFAMGATATAITNMQALARRHCPAPQACLIVPIVGTSFIAILNAVVLTVFLSLSMMGFG